MNTLRSLPNIGTVIENRLNATGIYTPEELISTGSKDAFIRIKMIDNTACLHMLYSLQGAIEGIHYTNLEENTKKNLKAFFITSQLLSS